MDIVDILMPIAWAIDMLEHILSGGPVGAGPVSTRMERILRGLDNMSSDGAIWAKRFREQWPPVPKDLSRWGLTGRNPHGSN